MYKEKIRIVEFEDVWTPGGVENYILQILKKINREKFSPIFWVTQKESEIYDDEIDELDLEVIPAMKHVSESQIIRVISSLRYFKATIAEVNCDVFHLHASNGVMLIYAYFAKKAGVEKVVVSSHSSNLGSGKRLIKRIGHEIAKQVFKNFADVKMACSKEAANWLFTSKEIKKGNVIKFNYIIDIEKFKFNELKRNEYREKYGIKKEFIFLNVGRFHFQKNQIFLVELFEKICKKINAKLLFIGEGKLESEIKNKVKELGINDQVLFLGTTRNVENYMWMADAFILPSLYEGNPITVTEAQASGLPCLISNKITKAAKILETTEYIDIDDESDCVQKIVSLVHDHNKNFEYRLKCNDLVKASGYDDAEQINLLERIYTKKNKR